MELKLKKAFARLWELKHGPKHVSLVSQAMYGTDAPPAGSALARYLTVHPADPTLDGDGDTDGDQVDDPKDPPEGPGGF